MDKLTLLRFVNDPGITDAMLAANALAIEGEIGGSINESINKAIDVAVQAAVIETIQSGSRKGHWGFKQEKKEVSMPPLPEHVEKPVTISRTTDATTIVTVPPATVVPKEENKNVVVQIQPPVAEPISSPSTPPVAEPISSPSTPPESNNNSKSEGRDEKIKLDTEISKGIKENTSLQGIKPTVELFGRRKLKEDSYFYMDPTAQSVKKWWFKKDTVVSVRQPGPEGWWRVMVTDSTDRSGWIKVELLEQLDSDVK